MESGTGPVSGWKILRAIALLPGMVTVVIPALILWRSGSDIGWGLGAPFATVVSATGGLLVAAGLFLLIMTIALLARIGRGTLAPWDPTQRMVVAGPYRHVRNPMISGVMGVLLGEALIFGSPWLVAWFAFFVALNATVIPLFEEPDLVRRFGAEYERYRTNVPRWVPRAAKRDENRKQTTENRKQNPGP